MALYGLNPYDKPISKSVASTQVIKPQSTPSSYTQAPAKTSSVASKSLYGVSYYDKPIYEREASRTLISPTPTYQQSTPTPAKVPTAPSTSLYGTTPYDKPLGETVAAKQVLTETVPALKSLTLPSAVPYEPAATQLIPSASPYIPPTVAPTEPTTHKLVPSELAYVPPTIVPTGPVTAKIVPTSDELLIARNPGLVPLGSTTVRTDVIEKLRSGDTETINLDAFVPSAPLPGTIGYVAGTKDLDPINIAAQVTMVARNPGLKILDKGLEAAIEALQLDPVVVASGDPSAIAGEVKRVFSEDKFKPLIAQARYEEVRGTLGPLHIQTTSYSGKTIGVERLRGDIDIKALIREGLDQYTQRELTDTRKSDLINKYPDVAMALLSGEASLGDVDGFFRSVADLEEQGKSVGLVTTDDENRLGRLVAKAKEAGASEETAQALVAQYINRLDTESKRKMSEWVEKGGLKENANMHLKLDDPGAELGDWMRDPTNQLYLTAAGVVAGGAGGLALKGLAGLAGGAVMGVFAGTELPNLANSSVFAESTIRKLEAAGAKDASMNIGDFRDRHADATRAYNDALKRGDLAEADRQARNIMKIQDDYSDYVVENWAAYQKAGVLDEVRGNIVENYDLAASQRLSSSPGSTASAQYDLSGFDPKSDWVRINGVTLSYFSGNSLELPPGEFVVEWGRSGYDPASTYVEVDKDGDLRKVDTSVANNDTKARISAITSKTPVSTDVFKGTTKTATAEKATAYAEGVDYKIVWQPGWKVQDPYTLEWKTSGDLKIMGDGATNVVFQDPEGNTRYTRVTNNDPYQSKYLTGLDSMPFVDTPYEPTRTAPKANTGTVIFGQDMIPGAEYYWDGKKIDPADRAKPVISGDHSLVIKQPGYKDVNKTVSVSGGETNYLSMYQAMTPETEKSSAATKSKTGAVFFGDDAIPGAKYYFDGKELDPRVAGKNVVPGDHTLIIQQAGYKDLEKTVYVNAGETNYLSLTHVMTPEPAAKTYTDYGGGYSGGGGGGGGGYSGGGGGGYSYSPPAPAVTTITYGTAAIGAEIYQDEVRVYPVIDELYSISPGYHAIRMTKPGKKPWSKTIYVSEGSTLTVSPAFEDLSPGEPGTSEPGSSTPTSSMASIIYGVTTSGAEIYQDDVRVYPVPGESYSISPGYHAVRINMPYKKPWTKTIFVGEDDTITVSPAFEDLPTVIPEEPTTSEPITRRVYINSSPSDAKILLDGLATGQWTPGYLDLEPGYYTIGISKSGYKAQEHPLWVSDIILWDDAAKNAARAAGAIV